MTENQTNQVTASNEALRRFSSELSSRTFAAICTEAGSVMLFLAFAVVGNALVCAAIMKNPVMSFRRTFTNIFIFGLALSDLAMACFCMPFCVGVLIHGKWNYSQLTCQFQGFLVCFLASTSLYTMLLTAVNRYICVVRPKIYNTVFTFKSTKFMLSVLWIVLLITGIFLTKLNVVEFRFHPGRALCLPFVTNEMKKYANVLRIVVVFCIFIVPCAVISTSYYKVFKTVRTHQITTASLLLQASGRISYLNCKRVGYSAQEIKMTRTLLIVVASFGSVVFSLLVLEAFLTIVNVSKTSIDVPRAVHLIWTEIGFSSSAVNPFIYIITCRAFRRLLRCRQPREVMPLKH